MARYARKAPYLLLAGALAASFLLSLVLTWRMTFFQDTFEFLMNRRAFTADALLQPHNEHIVVIPVAIQQLFLHLFGMDTARPEYVLLALGLVAAAGLVFIYVERRVGPWVALFATLLLLCLGPAWEVLLWPFEIGFVGSVLFGMAMLLALERRDRAGDVVACLALIASIGFSSLGIPFAVAAAVAIGLRPRGERLRGAYAVAIPVALYVVWYLGWGHNAVSHVSFPNFLASPRFVLDSMAAALGSLVGVGPDPFSANVDPAWGRVLLVALIAGLAVRKRRRPGLPASFWPVAAAAFANWFLTALNHVPGRDPTSSRYLYAGCVFVVLLLANLLEDVRFNRRLLIAAAAITLLAIGPNLVLLGQGRNRLQDQTTFTRADTASIEIARRTVSPSFELTPEIAGTPSLIDVFAGRYLEAVDEFGSPAYDLGELETASAVARKQADIVLSQALPLGTETTTGRYLDSAEENCVTVPGGEGRELALGPGRTRIEVAPGPPAAFSLRRFAVGEYPVPTAGAPGESTTVLTIPRDAAPVPWHLWVEADQPARVCR